MVASVMMERTTAREILRAWRIPGSQASGVSVAFQDLLEVSWRRSSTDWFSGDILGGYLFLPALPQHSSFFLSCPTHKTRSPFSLTLLGAIHQNRLKMAIFPKGIIGTPSFDFQIGQREAPPLLPP